MEIIYDTGKTRGRGRGTCGGPPSPILPPQILQSHTKYPRRKNRAFIFMGPAPPNGKKVARKGGNDRSKTFHFWGNCLAGGKALKGPNFWGPRKQGSFSHNFSPILFPLSSPRQGLKAFGPPPAQNPLKLFGKAAGAPAPGLGTISVSPPVFFPLCGARGGSRRGAEEVPPLGAPVFLGLQS